MKKMLLVLFALVVLANLSFAGTPVTNQGERGLIFMINGLGDFGLQGLHVVNVPGNNLYGFGGKYYISNNTELRVALNFNSRTITTKTPGGDIKDNWTTIGIAPALLWHCPPAGPVSPYWGLMGEFGMSKYTNTPIAPGVESSSSGTAFGLAGVLGAEWWAFDNVSFTAEYNVGVNAGSTKSESGGVSTDGPSYLNFGISSWAVGLNVGIGQ